MKKKVVELELVRWWNEFLADLNPSYPPMKCEVSTTEGRISLVESGFRLEGGESRGRN